MPRSGTNWVSQILASSPDLRMKFCPLFSYEFKNRLDASASPQDWRILFDEVYATPTQYLDQEYLRRDGLVPRFTDEAAEPSVLGIKSTRFHDFMPGLVDKAPYLRLAVLVRHPVAVIHSWLTNALEFPAEADPLVEWRSGNCRKTGPGEFWGFDDWVDTTQAYLRLEAAVPDRVRIFRYEDLVTAPEQVSRELLDFAGVGWSDQSSTFVRASTTGRSTHKRSVFKSAEVADRWRREGDPRIRDAILSAVTGTELARFTTPSGETREGAP